MEQALALQRLADSIDNTSTDSFDAWSERTEAFFRKSPEEQAETVSSSANEGLASLVNVSSKLRATILMNVISLDEKQLLSFLRVTKNWIRWSLQVLPPRPSEDIAAPFRDTVFLGELIHLIHSSASPNVAQCSSQIIFFATLAFDALSADVSRQVLHTILSKHDLMNILLKHFIQSEDLLLLLSLVRNIHNAAATFVGQVETFKSLRLPQDEKIATAKWVDESDNTIDGLESALAGACVWCVTGSSFPPFPGQAGDLRAEVVVTILRCLYALHVDATLDQDSLMGRLTRLLLELKSDDPQVYQCQLQFVQLFSGCSANFVTAIMEKGLHERMFAMLQKQVDEAVSGTTAAVADANASLLPILSVVYEFCVSDTSYRKLFGIYVFPEADEPEYQRLKDRANENGRPASTNMKPLHAPPGTFRFNLISLLAFPHTQIKRITGELFWLLCGSDAQEFVSRVGMGNAMPILGAKGLTSLPSNIFS